MSEKDECVKVVVRSRPMSEQELQDNRTKVVFMDLNLGQVIVKPGKDEEPKIFTFDHVYDETCQQLLVYKECGHPIVSSIMEGYNGTIFAYGQTGSGKTHTMEGKGSPEDRGIIPNAFFDIFSMISHMSHKQFLVRVGYVEIYQEEVFDLLAKRKKCELREDKDSGVYVKGQTFIGIKSEKEIEKVMEVGKKNRKVGATAMNPFSSRSHSVFSITVESSEMLDDGRNHITVGKLNLVDLAGSERQAKTHAEGDRLKEAITINLSLSALGNVIKALVNKKQTHVPYRDSLLTRLLQDSLGGNTKTVMIATVGPADYNLEETISTLRYATRAKSIKNKPRINEDPKDAMLRQFQEEIQRLKQLLSQQSGGAGGVTIQSTLEAASAAAAAAGVVGGPALSEEQLRAAEEERKRLLEQKGAVEASLQRTQEELTAQAELLDRERREREELVAKLASLENQVLAGGTIMEKAREQEQLLRMAEDRFKAQEEEQMRLRYELEAREAELDEHLVKYNSVQEEAAHKTRQLKKMFSKLQAKQAELEDLQAEFDQEREDMLDTIRELARQLKYQKAIIDTMIPAQELQAIEPCLEWDPELDDWVLVRPVVSTVQRELKLKDLIIDAFIPPPEVSKILKRAEWDPEHNEYVIQRVELAGNRVRAGRAQSSAGSRPMSAFAKAHALSGSTNPRFRAENIIDVPPEMPMRYTQDLDDLHMQDMQMLLHEAQQAQMEYEQLEAHMHGGAAAYAAAQARPARPPSRHSRPKTASKRPPVAPTAPTGGPSPALVGEMRAELSRPSGGADEVAGFPRPRGLVRPPSATGRR